jgi:hypothetical protein
MRPPKNVKVEMPARDTRKNEFMGFSKFVD